MMTACPLAPEVELLVGRVANESVPLDKFTYGVANLFEVITNTVIQGLTVGKKIERVAILDKEQFKKCADILLSVAPAILVIPKKKNGTTTEEPPASS